MERMSKEEYYLNIALCIAQRSSCLRRKYGCVIVNNNEIISTGYNGSPRGYSNCCDTGICKRSDKQHNEGDYSECRSVHAEQNAMISASRKNMLGSVMYLSCIENGNELENIKPCPICARMILNSGIEYVITKNKIYNRDMLCY